ncbi:hypothetical protein O4220_11560 [Rhodococcus ruber]|uniref:Aromatic-ring-hydroxylating dioxygenase subunit beta n=1 Tax=Rhodococcus ruber TaxID=1830 RepID=A0ABT4MDU9_9NOCA|nr:aromatic-ring-hydroxylating dioxygenase subunit beta [Rhodococcus ruber]MCZ4519152.1 hypothetical protein [Rhodococcus ruber]
MADTAVAALSIADTRVVRAIELIWREADLLDRKQYQTWKDLYSEDGRYVVPIDSTGDDFDNRLNMIYDDARMRDMRVVRMTEGYAIAAVDAAVTTRTVSRFVVDSFANNEIHLRASQIIVAFKRGRHDLWAGDVEYRIRLGDEGNADRIVLKVIRLVDSEDAVPAAGFLL